MLLLLVVAVAAAKATPDGLVARQIGQATSQRRRRLRRPRSMPQPVPVDRDDAAAAPLHLCERYVDRRRHP